MSKEERLILVGVISAAHGIKGDVLIKSFTEVTTNLAKLPIINEQNEIVKLKLIRANTKDGIICRLAGCDDRNHAETLKGTKLYCLRKDLPIPTDEEFYIEDLRGLKVIDESGAPIGTVLEIANYGAGNILEIKFTDDSCEMLPFTKELFPIITKDHIVFAKSNLRIK